MDPRREQEISAQQRKNNPDRLQKLCDDFNSRYPVGTPVAVLQDGGNVRETITTAEAQVLSGHSAVIWLKGISGCYLLERVSVRELPPAVAQADALLRAAGFATYTEQKIDLETLRDAMARQQARLDKLAKELA